MAVRQEPVPYVQLTGDGASRSYDDLYGLYQRIQEMQRFYLLRAVLCVLGIAYLVSTRLLRADRRRAEARLAALTRHVPGEMWWLAAILALLTMVFSGGYNGDSPFDLWYYGWMGSSLTDALRLLALLTANTPALLVLVWALWLRHITRKNTEPDQRWSLLGALKNALLARDLKLPVQKRLRRCAAAGIFSLILIPIGASPAILSILDRVFYASYAPVWYVLLLFFLLLYILLFCWTIFSYRHITRTARDIGLLADQVTAIRDGDLETPLDLPADADLRQTAEQLNDIQAGLHRALAEQTRSERMKVELISNVSHDLKTPLTSVLSYAELLRQEPLEGAAADYARIIDEKAHRLSAMVQDVFEVSKAASGQLPVQLERLDFAKLLRQTLADLEGPISQSGLTFKVDLPEQAVMITADGRRLYRVFQNLIDNALKYALEGSRIYLTLKTAEGRAVASLRNTSREELPDGVDLTARFVRGDASRTDGGSGLGLSIASSFTEACGGAFRVETLADLFTAVVSFPLADGE
ncbi:MAG TPA: HAMP domain-containing histidine kinase [Candidatus Oscillibacter excrementigallinarum]|uniref:histidine kinase n=1 Tax=Candidatus Oscillibacter excrementigallinarum TaxID=2838716 RepID=A0A9D2RS24_9FIRM|nr:HAMP domain-containing histidine kinase [Candidatus Oscillibacter excrementigallinarum]